MRTSSGIVVIVVICLLFSGCIQMSVESKVSKDCNIKYYKISMNMSSFVYNLMQQGATKEGYSSLRNSFYSRIPPKWRDHFSYDEIWHGNYVTIIITARDIPLDNKYIFINKENNKIFYKDYTFDNMNTSMIVAMGGAIRYSLEMPGKIIDSNANIVKENKAIWYITKPTTVYAVSEVPIIPGFEISSGLIAGWLVLTLLIYKRRR